MSLQHQAETFLARKRIAVVGVSREPGTGNAIFNRLQKAGYDAVPVNPHAAEIEGVPCYPSVQAIPAPVEAVVIVTRPEVTETVVRDCAAAGVSRVWMHENGFAGPANSSVSAEAVAFCRENGIEVIAGGCPLMFGPTADFGHKCMRWLLGVMGRLPESA
jgi:acyl-CoA synthetase (NDP forming)